MLLTRSPLTSCLLPPKFLNLKSPFDLHVLGAPPAFVLSQDQTLYSIVSKRIPPLTSSSLRRFDVSKLLVLHILHVPDKGFALCDIV